VLGVVLVLIAIFIAGPIALFLAGAVWSALLGWMLSDDADARIAGDPAEGANAAQAA
jgi:hypothetical protein